MSLVVKSSGWAVSERGDGCWVIIVNPKMAEIFWECELVSKLNQLSLCPLPLVRFILLHWQRPSSPDPTHFRHALLRRAIANQAPSFHYLSALAALEYLFRQAHRLAVTAKQLTLLLKENTLLSDECTQLVVESYEAGRGGEVGSGREVGEAGWSVCSLRQSQQGTQPNKIYVKVEMRSEGRQEDSSRTVSMSLLEFKVLREELGKVESLLGR